MTDKTVEEIKAIYSKYAMQTSGKLMITGGQLLMDGNDPTPEQATEIDRLSGASDILAAFGQDVGFLPLEEEDDGKSS